MASNFGTSSNVNNYSTSRQNVLIDQYNVLTNPISQNYLLLQADNLIQGDTYRIEVRSAKNDSILPLDNPEITISSTVLKIDLALPKTSFAVGNTYYFGIENVTNVVNSTKANFPATGASNTYYYATDEYLHYKWNGTDYEQTDYNREKIKGEFTISEGFVGIDGDRVIANLTSDLTLSGNSITSSNKVVDEDSLVNIVDSGSTNDKVPTALAVRTAITASGHDPVTVTSSSEIDFTLTDQNITATLIDDSIAKTRLTTAVQNSLDLADSSLQPGNNLSDVSNKVTARYNIGADLNCVYVGSEATADYVTDGTDDHIQIQQAIDDVLDNTSANGNKKIVLLPGTFNLYDSEFTPIEVDFELKNLRALTLEGTNPHNTILQNNATTPINSIFFKRGSGSVVLQDDFIMNKNLQFKGNSTCGTGIKIYNISQGYIGNCFIKDFTDPVTGNGIDTTLFLSSQIENTLINNCQVAGLNCKVNTNNVQVSNSWIYNCEYAIILNAANGNTFERVAIEGSNNGGAFITNGSSANVFSDCWVESNANHAFLDYGNGTRITLCNFLNNGYNTMSGAFVPGGCDIRAGVSGSNISTNLLVSENSFSSPRASFDSGNQDTGTIIIEDGTKDIMIKNNSGLQQIYDEGANRVIQEDNNGIEYNQNYKKLDQHFDILDKRITSFNYFDNSKDINELINVYRKNGGLPELWASGKANNPSGSPLLDLGLDNTTYTDKNFATASEKYNTDVINNHTLPAIDFNNANGSIYNREIVTNFIMPSNNSCITAFFVNKTATTARQSIYIRTAGNTINISLNSSNRVEVSQVGTAFSVLSDKIVNIDEPVFIAWDLASNGDYVFRINDEVKTGNYSTAVPTGVLEIGNEFGALAGYIFDFTYKKRSIGSQNITNIYQYYKYKYNLS